MPLTIPVTKAYRFFVLLAVFTVVCHVVTQTLALITGHDVMMGVIPMFNMNAETNVPTLLSTALLIIASLLLFGLALLYRGLERWFVKYWVILGVIFAVLALDEFTSIHERFDEPLRNMLETDGFLHFAWVIPYFILVLLVGLLFIRFLLRLNRVIAGGFVVAGILYVGGALGMEMLGGSIAASSGQQSSLFIVFATIEESLEIAGVLVFIRYLLMMMSHHIDTISFQFK